MRREKWVEWDPGYPYVFGGEMRTCRSMANGIEAAVAT
jgi:hypothetical protein